MPHLPPGAEPANLCLSLRFVVSMLRASALCKAMDMHTSTSHENVSNVVLDMFLVGMAAATGPLFLLTGSALLYARQNFLAVERVDVNYRQMMDRADRIHEQFLKEFLYFAPLGEGYQVLERRKQEGQDAWLRVQNKFRQAQIANNALTSGLDTAFDWTHRVKVAADVGMVVVGAIVPLGFLANTAAGLAYSLSCKFVNTMSEAGHSDLQSYSRADLASDAAGTAGNAAQAVAKRMDSAREAARLAQANWFYERCAGIAQRAGEDLAREVDQAARTGGAPSATVQRLMQEADVANANLSVAAGNRANHNPGTRLGVASGASIVVGLFFLKDEIKAAWIGKTAAERRRVRR